MFNLNILCINNIFFKSTSKLQPSKNPIDNDGILVEIVPIVNVDN